MKEIRKKKKDDLKPKRFSSGFQLIAFVLVFAFVFQSMDTINNHTYGTKGVSIHRHNCTTPTHISSFCEDIDTTIF